MTVFPLNEAVVELFMVFISAPALPIALSSIIRLLEELLPARSPTKPHAAVLLLECVMAPMELLLNVVTAAIEALE